MNVSKSVYLDVLDRLSETFEAIPNTPLGMYLKTIHLIVMNMRYEIIAFNHHLKQHPYLLTRDIIQAQLDSFNASREILFIEDPLVQSLPDHKSPAMEEKHRVLFNLLWNTYDKVAYEQYVDRYKHRLRVNDLIKLIEGKRCLDIGCGNGNFCHALVDLGAAFAAGIDYGADSIAYADKVRETRTNGDKCEFKVATVYKLPYRDDEFDYIIQNGVFHHLDDEYKAILEARRVLKIGGYFWYYTDGEGGISYQLWDRSVHLLREVPEVFIQNILNGMNVSKAKKVHIMDGLNATYHHTSWKDITGTLQKAGFGDFKRLTGGFSTDFDLDVIHSDPFGREKFGEGDLRILARLLKK